MPWAADLLAATPPQSLPGEELSELLRTAVAPTFRFVALGLETWQWLGLAVLLAIAVLCAVVTRLLSRPLARLLRLHEASLPNGGVRSGGRALSMVVAVEVAWLLLPAVELPDTGNHVARFCLKVLAALAWLCFLNFIWDLACGAFSRHIERMSERGEKLLAPFARKLGRFFIGVGVLVYLLAGLGFNVGGIVAGLGVGGVALALAAKDTVENLFGSLTIVLDMPFGVGDWVKVGAVDGVVEEINLRSTRVRTFEDSVVTIPNSTLIRASVENMGARRRRGLKETVSLAFDTPTPKVRQFVGAVEEVLRARPELIEGTTLVTVTGFGDGAIKVSLNAFMDAPDAATEARIKQEVLLGVVGAAQRLKLNPFATAP